MTIHQCTQYRVDLNTLEPIGATTNVAATSMSYSLSFLDKTQGRIREVETRILYQLGETPRITIGELKTLLEKSTKTEFRFICVAIKQLLESGKIQSATRITREGKMLEYFLP